MNSKSFIEQIKTATDQMRLEKAAKTINRPFGIWGAFLLLLIINFAQPALQALWFAHEHLENKLIIANNTNELKYFVKNPNKMCTFAD